MSIKGMIASKKLQLGIETFLEKSLTEMYYQRRLNILITLKKKAKYDGIKCDLPSRNLKRD